MSTATYTRCLYCCSGSAGTATRYVRCAVCHGTGERYRRHGWERKPPRSDGEPCPYCRESTPNH